MGEAGDRGESEEPSRSFNLPEWTVFFTSCSCRIFLMNALRSSCLDRSGSSQVLKDSSCNLT